MLPQVVCLFAGHHEVCSKRKNSTGRHTCGYADRTETKSEVRKLDRERLNPVAGRRGLLRHLTELHAGLAKVMRSCGRLFANSLHLIRNDLQGRLA